MMKSTKAQKAVMCLALLPLSYFAYLASYYLLLSVLIIPLVYFSSTYIHHLTQMGKYPPGPFPLPVIGNLHLLSKKPYKTFTELSKLYGDVFSISFGMERVVIVNTIEPAREVLITKGTVFAGRPMLYTAGLISRGFQNMGFSDYGAYWITMRKLGHTSFQQFSKPGNKLEELTVIESEDLHRRLRIGEGNVVDPTHDIGLALINVICHICFGHRYDEGDEEFKEIIKFTGLIFAGLGSSDAVAVLPWLRIFPLEGLKKLQEGIKIRDPLLRRHVREHEETFDPENIRDLTDAMLKVRHDEMMLKNADLPNFTNDQMEMIINDIFVGAIETTLSTIRWGILYLVHWPRFQQMMFDEILNLLGPNKYPTIKDRSSLPIVQSFIQETLRYSSMAPLGVPHKAMQNDTISGHFVPKGAQILINHWNCHYDERHWEKPNEFNPLRWLDDKGTYIPGRHQSFIPFSAGRRNCFGEAIAKTQLFLLFSRMMKDFRIERDPDEILPSLEGELGITLSPYPFRVIFTSRGNRVI